MQNIYCFTGLGADERLFSKLTLPAFTLRHIQYIPPLAAETLPEYAIRLCAQVEDEDPILLGVSFGGMLALEAGKHVKAKQTILISSVKSAHEFPLYYQTANKFRLIKWLPKRMFQIGGAAPNYLFGAYSAEDKALLRDYLKSADTNFIKWALQIILDWKNERYPQNLIHLHGSNDKIIPLPKNVNHILKGGGHLMIYNRADEVSQLLQNCLTAQR